jgi:hypothetical protein
MENRKWKIEDRGVFFSFYFVFFLYNLTLSLLPSPTRGRG